MGKDILYETMKVITKQRNIKVFPEDDLYKKSEPFFYHAFLNSHAKDLGNDGRRP